jgi:DNA-binding winged helix-turn-helix (wHTH) protein/tetratricopeptide (TPR) repeat protein
VFDFRGDEVDFGPFRLSRARGHLLRFTQDKGWDEVRLQPKAFDLLMYMVENSRKIISTEEFLEQIWPDVHVQAEGLKGHMLRVRTALGDDPQQPAYIETVRGRGYRFIAPLSSTHPSVSVHEDPRGQGGPLVGRIAAQQELGALLQRACAGQTEICFVTGEPGIGKTALSQVFLDMARRQGARVIVAPCIAGSAESDAFYPFLDILAQLARSDARETVVAHLSTIAPTWLVQLPWLMPGTMEPGTRQAMFGTTSHRMIREMCELLENLSCQRPLVLVIEDIHWADQATLDLIDALAGRRLRSRLAVLSTMRLSGDGASAGSAQTLCQTLSLYRLAREIALKPLTAQDVKDYLAGLAGSEAPADLIWLLHSRSEGNPLFMQAVLEDFVQQGLVSLTGEGWVVSAGIGALALRAPPSLTRIIEGEIGRLPREAQEVLAAASLSDGLFCAAEHALAADLDEERFEVVCDELVRTTALIRRAEIALLPNGRRMQRYAFRHAIFRDVVYDRQSATRRVLAHRMIGERLRKLYEADSRRCASALARHFVLGEVWTGAIDALRLVGRNALQRFSTREATASLEQALSLVPNLPVALRNDTEIELLEDLARIYTGSLNKRASETFARLVEAARRAGRLDVECRGLLGWGFVLAWTDFDRSMAMFGEAIDKSASLGDPVARARVRTYAHGWRSWASGWSEEDAVACESALEEIRASGDVVALNASYVDSTLIAFPSSRYHEAHDRIQSCFEILLADGLEQRADISLPLWIFRLGRPWCLLCAGELGAAIALFEAGVASFLDNGEAGRGAALQFYHAFCHLHLQDFEGAIALCDQALEFCDAKSSINLSPNEQQIEMVVRGLAEQGRGRSDVAIGLLTAAGEVMTRRRTLTTWHWRIVLEWGMVDACLAAGHIEEARRHGARLHDLAYALRERTWRALASETMARLALRIDDLAAAEATLREAWAQTEAGPLPLATWRLHAVNAALCERMGHEADAARHRQGWQTALEALIDTLPPEHVGQGTLAGAMPIP